MFVQQELAAVATAQQALHTIATIWQITNYQYPAICEIEGPYDYIVIGGGSAGAVVASRLSENPNVTVLLLEAGGDPPMQSNLPGGANYLQNSYLDWDKYQQSQVDKEGYQCLRNQRQPISHGKVLGGGSSINLMMYMRGVPHDYEMWSDITGDPSWKYENILKYFIMSENLIDEVVLDSPYGKDHGTGGPMGVTQLRSKESQKYLDVYESVGFPVYLDINANGSLGFNNQMVTVANGERQSTANAYLKKARGRNNLKISRGSLVTKIIIDDNNVAQGAEYLDQNNKTHKVYANKEVILSAGPINGPQILMLSGVGPKEVLEKFDIPVKADLPVGKKILNHHGVFTVYKTEKVNPNALQPPSDPHNFPFPIITGLLPLNESQTYPTYMAATVVMESPALALTFCSIVFAFDVKTCQTMFDDTIGRQVLFAAIVHINQDSRGHVTLKSADPQDPPDVHIVAYPNKESFETTLDCAEDFGRVMNSPYFKETNAELVTLPQCSMYDKSSREYLSCYARCVSSTYYHYCGTNAMGSVTNSRLRVMGIDHLRIVDSSVFPYIVSGTPNVPTVMVGEKGAAMIKEDNND